MESYNLSKNYYKKEILKNVIENKINPGTLKELNDAIKKLLDPNASRLEVRQYFYNIINNNRKKALSNS